MPPDDIAEWTPISLRWETSGPEIDWRRLNGRRFVEPFFDQTIQKHHKETPSVNRTTPAETLLAHAEAAPLLPPASFIFHPSRCGSTLMAQMLASLPQNVVLSEPAIFDQVLFPKAGNYPVTEAEQAHLFRAVVGVLSRPRHADEQRCFIKFSSRAVSKLPLIRSVYPDVPWIFLYREPLEILGQLLRSSAERLPPGVADSCLVEGDPAELAEMRPEEFWARMLAARFADALKFYQPGKTLLMNYTQLPEAVCGPMLNFFSITVSQEDMERMRKTATWDAKAPSKEFRNDSRQNRREVPESAKAILDRLVMPHYSRLESIRMGQGA